LPFFVGGIIGTLFLTKISATALSFLIIIALLSLLAYMIFGKDKSAQELEELRLDLKRYPLLGSIMVVLGVYSNVSGVGSGTFQKIAFTSLLRMKIVDGIGIGNIIYTPLNIFSIIVTAFAGLLAWPYVIALWFGTFIGSHFVAKHIRKVPDHYLRVLLIVVSLVYLIYLVWSLLR